MKRCISVNALAKKDGCVGSRELGGGRWSLLSIQQPPPESKFSIGSPGQFAEPGLLEKDRRLGVNPVPEDRMLQRAGGKM